MGRCRVAITALLVVAACGGSTQGVPERLTSATEAWETDFSITSIELDELVVGVAAGDPRDVIPPLDDPNFQSTDEANGWLTRDEPGLSVDVDGSARFYPLRILNRHEIVNDQIGDTPVLVTYCPLCNSALVFDPRVSGNALRFGTSGLLRRSDLVMWDGATQSLWQQLTGEAIVGELTGSRLSRIPSAIIRWGDFVDAHPDGEVLGRNQGRKVLYGDNPYVAYSRRSTPMSEFFDGEIDGRLPALERVVGIASGGEQIAVSFAAARQQRAVNVDVGGDPVVVMWGAPSTVDPLEAFTVAAGDPIGTAIAYSAELDGVRLTFDAVAEDRFTDRETGSEWTLAGEAVAGPLEGSSLQLAIHTNEFWFAWQAFNDPDFLIAG